MRLFSLADIDLKLLGHDIYVAHNFLNTEEQKFYGSLIERELYLGKGINLSDKTVIGHLSEFSNIGEKIKSVIAPDLFLNFSYPVNILQTGQEWGVHSDDHDYLQRKKAGAKASHEPIYGVVVYFNNFEGGELFYPNQNIIYKPQSGDLVIHSAKEHCSHEVLVVKQGPRYSYSNALSRKITVS